ncbi:hypothetical protein AGABI2DRAFT_153572 [Agaricus bisporus var. bisporus H97]|uniref:hypothetical protein n=1 Tax=Agaricus bisporus var. bisporus (strain H97 / ATCC MYA-4626 / FGSC 10389) TaxID=936046 RepID=UPI00029F615E|nr:hypothetical protein AGABI2DRAFT_153572 [Agaricus bisporus var. bisporus H97]EKV43539.1 hypothetical protein AGABI2DRAFT_153572 [Agaricus bisporus var. bisporus H97]
MEDFGNQDDFEDVPLSAALTSSLSPTIPDGMSRQRDTLRAAPDGTLLMPPLERYLKHDGNDEYEDDDEFLTVRRANRDSSRSSTSTISTSTVTGSTYGSPVIGNASIVRRATRAPPPTRQPPPSPPSSKRSKRLSGAPPSPMNSQFGSDESATSVSTTSSSSQSQDHPTPTTDSTSGAVFDTIPSPRDTFGNLPKANGAVKVVSADADIDTEVFSEEDDDEEGTWDTVKGNAAAAAIVNHSTMVQPAIIVSDGISHSFPEPPAVVITSEGSSSNTSVPLTPGQRYPGWLSVVVEPLSSFIDEAIEPRDHYVDLQEIAEGESGSIFAARVVADGANKLRLPEHIRSRDAEEFKKSNPVLVAIKIITTAPHSPDQEWTPEAQKLVDLERELTLMKGLWHENILGLDALYVDLTEDTLWVRMELMERSLADIVGLVVDGLMLQDRMIARFARDVLQALEYLQENRIAHRDVRSDNLLLNSHGVVKLTDFSNAVKLPKESSLRSDPAGVIFWQAPEMRYPNYDALKVDVWSLGATMWEMAETEPPFSDTKQVQSRWPPLTRPEMWSPAFHTFLRTCSDAAAVRKSPTELLKDPFVGNACGRTVIVQLLSQCMNIERMIQGDGGS